MIREISFESLEQRTLMSVTTVDTAVTVRGDDNNTVTSDSIVLRRSSADVSKLEVLVNGQLQLTRLISKINTLKVLGVGGDDKLSVDNTNGAISLPSGQPIQFDGGIGSNTIVIKGGVASSAGFFGSGNNSGDVSKTIDGQFQRLSFSNVGLVQELSRSAKFGFVGRASGTETTILSNGTSDTDGVLRITHSVAGGTFTALDFAGKSEVCLDTDQGSAGVLQPENAIVLSVNGGDRDLLTLRNSESGTALSKLTVLTHFGADVVKIEGQNAPITLNSGDGSDIVIVGNPGQAFADGGAGAVATGTLNVFAKEITITDTPDSQLSFGSASNDVDILTLDDGGDTTDNLGELGSNGISGLGLGGKINYSGMETVNLQLGSAKDTLNVRSTASGVSYNIAAGAGSDLIRLGNRGTGSSAGGGTVNTLLGSLSINGGTGVNTIVLDDSGETTNNTGNLIPGKLTGMGMADVLFSNVSRVNVFCGSGDDSFINQILPGGAITVAVDLGAGEA